MELDADSEFQIQCAYWNDRLVDIVWSERSYATGRCRLFKKVVQSFLRVNTKEIVLANVLLDNGSVIREVSMNNIREHDPERPQVEVDPEIPF